MSFKSAFISPILAAALVACVTLATKPAAADTITFGSFAGTSAPGLSNSQILYDNFVLGAPFTPYTFGAASAFYPGYASTIAGTTWVSYDPHTGSYGDNGGVTDYLTSYTGNLLDYFGSITLQADDTVSAYLNGKFIGTTAGSSYATLKTFAIDHSFYTDGTNVFDFKVTNANGPFTNGGPTGFDFIATAQTPEPSSLILLGTGLIGVAGALRRRLTF